MATLNLFKKLSSDKAEPPKFLALEITSEIVQAAVWHVVEGKTELVTTGSPVEWDGKTTSPSELLSAIDATVSGATEGLSPEPTEVVLGVSPEWTKDGSIDPDKRQLLRDIFAELELKALGFVVILDSVIHHLKLTEGMPPTAIFIQVLKGSLNISLVNLGKVATSTTCKRSESITTDVESALATLAGDTPLPARILVFNSMHDLDQFIEELTAHNWSTKHNFLHIPTTSALPRDIAIRAIAAAGGAEIVKALGFAPQKEAVVPEPEPVLPLASAADLGFSSDPPLPQDPALPPPRPRPKFSLPSFTLPSLPHPHLPSLHFSFGRAKALWLIPILVLAALAAAVALYWFVPHASVQITVTPKPINESLSFVLDPTPSDASAANVVPGTTVEHNNQQEATIETTGKKTIGDQAHGEVTIYNRTSLPKTFTKGTSLTGGGLKFTLTDAVTVASRSAGSDYVDVPGKATVSVTATTIGTEGNLQANTEFTIASYSKDTYVGKNTTAFTGGSSSTIRVVQQADKDSLLASLQSSLLTTAKSELEQGLDPSEGLYLASGSATFTTTSTSAEVGDEADQLTITLELDAQAVKYRLSDVETLVSKAITSSIPSGFVRSSSPPTVQIDSGVVQKDGSIEVQAEVAVQLVPELDTTTIKNLIRGKSLSELPSLFANIPGYLSFSSHVTPAWLPPRWSHLPRNLHNIIVTITPVAN